MHWLRGEYATKTEARRDLGVGTVIDDDNWFDFIKLFARFVQSIGYKGLLVFFDECVNLYKIANRISRENNYEKLLFMYNDTLQGRAPYLGLYFGGTPAFLEDQRRGLYSYEALRSRLSDGRIAQAAGFRTMSGPIIRLKRMSDNELLALCRRVTALHEQLYRYQARVAGGDIERFLRLCLDRPGAGDLITPREILREYLTVLDVLRENEGLSFSAVIGDRPPVSADLERANAENGLILEEFDL